MASGTGLGKGLSALFRETQSDRIEEGIHTLPLKDITPNKEQPRRTFHDKSLAELAESIKVHGLLQPIIVRPLGDASPGKYEIVAGERRYRACKLAQLLEVPVVVKLLTSEETLAAALVENIQREDLNAVEEAIAIQTLKDAFSLSQEDVAVRLGKSRSAIANCLRLLALPPDMHKDIVEGSMTAGHARALLSITETAAQAALHQLIVSEHLSVREAEGLANRWKETGEVVWQKTAAPEQEGEAKAQAALGTSSGRTGRGRKPQSAVLLQVQEQIGGYLNAKVKVTGQESKGKITISYTSKEDLEAILQKMASLNALPEKGAE